VVTLKRKLGNLGEDVAEKYLKRFKYEIIERNYNRKWGEIDIVARLKNSLVFAEVKSKKAGSDFLPAQNVNFEKQNRLKRAAQTWLMENKIPAHIPWQIDVLIIELDETSGLHKIEHLKNCVH
jgi:putative endonuclease